MSLDNKRNIQQFYKVKFNYLLYFLGSGITYYVFERFSMTPIYEVFTILCLIHLTQQFIINPQSRKLYSFLIPLSILFSILVRWTNLYVFLVPIIVLLSYKDFKPDLFKKLFNIYFFISSVLSFLIFIFLSKQIYGVLTFSPSYVYMVDEFDTLLSDSILKNFFNFILEFLKDFIIINFSQEFGLFWFSPIIFIAIFLIIYRIIFYKILLSSLPVMIVGFFLIKFDIISRIRNIETIAWMTLLFGILLFISDKLKAERNINNHFDYKSVLLIGFMQILSLIPGVSRSGIAITTARLLKFKRTEAAKISFLISIPILGAVSIYGIRNLFLSESIEFTKLNLVSIVISFIFSFLTIKYFLKYIKKFNLNIFVYYRVFLGLVLIVFAYL